MRLALIGVGFIGGSFARALRAAGKVDDVIGFDSHRDALRRATDLGVIDQSAESAARAVEHADLVVIATPVGSIRQILRDIAPHLSRAAIITDVGSTKASVVEAASEELREASPRFVPGHPIAGGEQSGVEYADGGLFREKIVITTPVPRTDPWALEVVEALWHEVGCHVERMTPRAHDAVFAAVSHLPHLIAFALVAHIAEQPDAKRKFVLAGPGFRDFTRIAASDPVMWSDICISNSSSISDELRAYRERLERLQRTIDAGDREVLQQVFRQAAAVRRGD